MFSDDRLSLYPDYLRGGDSEVSRWWTLRPFVFVLKVLRAKQVLRKRGSDTRLPVAITEASSRLVPEEQARWLAETWNQAEDARAEGVRRAARKRPGGCLALYDWSHSVPPRCRRVRTWCVLHVEPAGR